MKKERSVIALMAGLVFSALMVEAELYISPDLTTFTSTSAVGWAYGSVGMISDGSGLDTPVASINDANIGSVTHATGFSSTTKFLKPGTVSGTFDFTFSTPVEITDLYVWNYSQGNGERGVGDYNLYLDTGSGFGSAVASGTLLANLQTGSGLAQQISLGGTYPGVVGVRLAGSAVNINQADPHMGLEEVVFRTIPEPATLGLVALFGGGMLFVRRRLTL